MVHPYGASIDRRIVPIGVGVLAAACVGAASGQSPLLGLGLVVAVAAVAVVVADLATGIIVFTLASFTDDLPLSSSATAGKAVGFVLLVGWVAALAVARRPDRRPWAAGQRRLLVCLAVFVAWNVLSAAWAQSPSAALSGASRFAMDSVLFPILFTGVRDLRVVRRVTVAFVVGAVVSVAFGALTGTVNPGDPSRLAGALGDANETAMGLVATAVLAFALGASARRRSLAQIVALLAGVASVVGIVDTGSRGGLVALVVAAVAGVALAGRRSARSAVPALVAIPVLVVLFFAVAPAGVRQHLTAGGTDGRATLWTLARRSIEANPVQGLGNDNFALDSRQYLLQAGATDSARLSLETPKVAHNIYLEIWSDLGIVGLVLFLGVVALSLRCGLAAIRALRRLGRRGDELLARGLVVAVIGMLVADFFISDIYSKQLWLLLALLPALGAVAHREGRSAGPVSRGERPLLASS